MVLLVVDTQKLIVKPELYEFQVFEQNVKNLIRVARENQIEVIYVQHDDGPGEELTKGVAGYEIYDEFKPEEGEAIFAKNVNSPFKESGLLEYLKNKSEDTIIVTGLQTDYCIDATVKCGFEHGFCVIVPENANSTYENEFMSAQETYEYYNHFIWKRRYAKCISCEDTIFLMQQKNRNS